MKRGISLLVLVITMIVIMILAGAVILSLSKNNPILQAEKATFLSDVKNFQTELDLYETHQFSDKRGSYDPLLLQGDETSVTYDGVADVTKTMYDLVPSLGRTEKYSGQFKILDGKLVFQGSDKNKQDWASESGVNVVIVGELTVNIFPPTETLVKPGTDIVYTIKFTSNAALTNVDLTGKVEVLDDNDVAIQSQPVITIGAVSGTNVNSIRQVDVTIKTNTLTNGTYKLKVKPGAITNADNLSNTKDTISFVGFDVDSSAPVNPVMSAEPSTWTNGNVTISITYSADSVAQEYSLDTKTWNAYTSPIVVAENGITVYAKGKDSVGNETGVASMTVSNIDKTVPVVIASSGGSTTSSVTVTAVASDVGGSGLVAASYQYSKDNGTTWTAVTSVTSYTFSSITAGTYQCKVKVADNATNSTTSSTVAISTTGLGTITLGASPTGWTNGDVQVTILYPTEVVTKQYSTNGTTWNSYTAAVTVTTNNTTVYAKGLDAGGNQTVQASMTVSKIDKDIPTVVYGTNAGTNVPIASTNVTVSDTGGSSINSSTLQYVWSTSTTTPSSGWVAFTNGNTLTKTDVVGTYYLWIKASDNAGNSLVSKTNAFVLVFPEYSSSEGVNIPKLAAGMTAKKWNGSSWDTVASPSTDTTWYDYTNKQWANAQTADGSMWVWIPRYEYKITSPHSSTAQTIAVNFLNNISTTATSGYTVHPAFTFGSTELTGIWIAKFEASGTTSAVDVKPGVTSLRSITIDAMFTACRNMETTNGSRYGWGTTGTGIDTHLMKNTEWGAVAYLTQSIYGKNSEVWINPNSSYITGQAGTSVSASGTLSTYAYDNMAYGVNASATGNISGVYDMSGGALEYTAAYVNNGNANLTTYGSSLVSSLSKYKDLYTSSGDTSSGNYSAASIKKGDAVYETSTATTGSTSWYSDYSYMPYSDGPFFNRGGYYSNASDAGTFTFSSSNGGAYIYYSFRPTLSVSGSL